MASVKRTITRNGTQIKRAIAYARFSSNNQREESIDAQLRAIREYCEKNGIVLVDVFTDEAISGKSDNRDGFQQMISGITKGFYEVDAVLVHKFSRFSRNKFDSALYKKRLKDMGVKVISVTQTVDDSPEGELLEGFLEVIDSYYSANLAVEVRKGLRENALKGKHPSGKLPLGLSLDSEGYYIQNEQSDIVRRIFEEYAAGVPKSEICERLNKDGYRNQKGKPFNTRTLYDILRNEKYIGNFIYTIDRSETIRIDGIIKDPIVDNQLWQTVQKLNESGTIKGRYRKQKKQYYLTGKTFCEHCGSPISGAGSKRSRNGDLNYYYKCVGKVKHKNGCTAPSINKEWFENKVLESVVSFVMNEEQINYIAKTTFKELEKIRERPAVSLNDLRKELSEIAKKQEMLTELLLEGDIDKNMLNDKNAGLKSRKFEIENEIEKRKMLDGTEEVTEESIAEYITSYIKFLKETHTAEDEFMRAVFATFVDSVVVGKEKITVNIYTDFNRIGDGYNEKITGQIFRLEPVKLTTSFKRKPIRGKLNK